MNVVVTRVARWSILVGAALLALGAARWRAERPRGNVRLVLEAARDPRCYYGTAFTDGELIMPAGALDGARVVMTSEFPFGDGCRWRSTETLEMLDADRYRYRYEEAPIACAEGARPAPACPLGGSVRVIQ